MIQGSSTLNHTNPAINLPYIHAFPPAPLQNKLKVAYKQFQDSGLSRFPGIAQWDKPDGSKIGLIGPAYQH